MMTVVLVVTGSVAAYKAPIVARLLLKQGFRVRPILTRSATEFVGSATMSGLTQEPVLDSAFGAEARGELHITLASEADIIAVVPATADFLARLAQGRADDLATATCLSTDRPIFLAPAMHPRMWHHPATQRNVALLRADGRAQFIGPEHGEVASGDRGTGRMSEPEDIARAITAALGATSDLAGRHIVVSAGPTVEDLDPVRFLTNRSTGRMGFAVARRAKERGARVTLVTGPVSLGTPNGVHRVDVRDARQMQSALQAALAMDSEPADALVMTAAIGDYRPAHPSDSKIKREKSTLTLELVMNPDVLAEIGAARAKATAEPKRPVLVGFAVETEQTDEGLVAAARKKLVRKQVDFVVANRAADAFGSEDNVAILVGMDHSESVGTLSKLELADRILDRVRAAL